MVLNGMASPDTRAVLLSGEHPMLANGARARGIQDMSTVDQDTEMSGAAMPDTRPRPKQNGGGKGAVLQGRGGLGNIPQLTGVTQIVGLALGSPEFQRH